ncbi:MAG: CopD family protein [Proteobacteria bacterium]|nr:CopD family protein [Pseudomonadota bacterium]MBI3499083.1 CopD family protein [Pseudomonadota bacterium]
MSLLLDVFGYLTVLLHGSVLAAQSLTLGGVAFLLILAEPLAGRLGGSGATIAARSRRLLACSSLALALLVATAATIQILVLADTAGIGLGAAAGADFALADAAIVAASLAMALRLSGNSPAPRWLLVSLACIVIVGSVATSHAASRLDDRPLLMVLTSLHQIGAAIWIGGMPYFLLAMAQARDGGAWRLVGKRFSLMSTAAVALIVGAGTAMAWVYVADFSALYGTAYGVMTSTKVLMFLGLLGLGFANFRAVERLRRDPTTPVVRLRRFAEVELGVGLTVLFAAASLTSLPPATDLPFDRVSWAEIVERNVPHWPRFESPSHEDLAIPALQAKLDAEAARAETAARAFVPGAGLPPPISGFDIAWSEYNHHWAGILVLAIGILALVERSGLAAWARHWPLLFLALALFLLVRSDPEAWPLGDIGFWESLRDPEVVQHRLFVLLLVPFALFEWAVRTGRLKRRGSALVFPLLTAFGGGLLLTHSHSLGNVRQELLIEMTHVPLALFGIAAGWTRWLELRLPEPESRIAGWAWPICFVAVGLSLLLYRES